MNFIMNDYCYFLLTCTQQQENCIEKLSIAKRFSRIRNGCLRISSPNKIKHYKYRFTNTRFKKTLITVFINKFLKISEIIFKVAIKCPLVCHRKTFTHYWIENHSNMRQCAKNMKFYETKGEKMVEAKYY